jgi:hypothetical protein
LARAVIFICAAASLHVWGVRAPFHHDPPYSVVATRLASPFLLSPPLPDAPVSAVNVVSHRARTSTPQTVQVRTTLMRVPAVLARDSMSASLVPVGTSGRYADVLPASPPLEVAVVDAPEVVVAAVAPSPTSSLDSVVSTPPARREVEVPPLVEQTPRRERPSPIVPRVTLARASAPPVLDRREQEDVVRSVLREYTRALERFDVRATKVIYPTVDDRKLQRAFEDLEEQRVSLTSCEVAITSSGNGAAARCNGEATFRPKVGSRVLRLTDREWMFNLSRGGSGWQILDARIQ